MVSGAVGSERASQPGRRSPTMSGHSIEGYGEMKAAFLSEPYRLDVRDIDVPPVGQGEVLIRVCVAGVCGSDLHTYRGVHPFRKPPVVLGHELCGTVEDIGAQVQGFSKGQRVTVEPQRTCGECALCVEGRYNICPNKVVPGVGGWVGSMAEFFVAPASRTYPLDDGIDDVAGAVVEPLAVGVHAVRRAGEVHGKRVVVIGCGTIGLCALAAARLLGASRVDVSDVLPFKLEAAAEMGASKAVDVRESSLPEQLEGEADVVIIAAEHPRVIDEAMQICRRGGTVVGVALFGEPLAFNANQAVTGERELRGSMIYRSEDYRTVLQWLREGAIDLSHMVTHWMPLAEAARALEMMDKVEGNPIKILLEV